MPSRGNIFLAIPVKKTQKVDVKGPIERYIQQTRGGSDLENAQEDLETLQNLRKSIVQHSNAGIATAGSGLDEFAKYYRALTAIETRFPVSSDRSHVNISFTWTDTLKNAQRTQCNVYFEKAGVLFCLAAIYSQKAVAVQRTTQEGIFEACNAFSCAAGLWQMLRDKVAGKIDSPGTADISSECCDILERLMLAQAQECFYEALNLNEMITSMKRAKAAKQVSLMYAEIAQKFRISQLNGTLDKNWKNVSRIKKIMYEAESLLHAGYDHKASNEQGKYVSRLRAAEELFNNDENKSAIKKASADLQKHAAAVSARVSEVKKEAEQENRTIYMELAPAPSTLPAIDGEMLVSCKLPQLLSGNETWFKGIVPVNVTKRSVKYSGLVDDVARDILDSLAKATEEAQIALLQHELPHLLNALPGGKAELPDRVLAALQDDFVQRGGAVALQNGANFLFELHKQVTGSLDHCSSVLDEEQRSDESARQFWGAHWTRERSSVLAASLRSTISRYRGNLVTAAQSDKSLFDKVEKNKKWLLDLSPEHARARLPSLEAPLVTTGAADPATVVQNLRQALDALSQLGAERGALEERLKEMRLSDNVIPLLLNAGPEEADALLESRLEQYKPLQDETRLNTQRQAELLNMIQRNMSAFQTVYDMEGWRQERERVADDIVAAVSTGNEIMSQINEGVEFYTGLQSSTEKLQQMCADYAMGRNINLREEQDMLSKRKVQQHTDEEAARALAAELARAETSMSQVSLHSQQGESSWHLGSSAPQPGASPGGYRPGAPPPPTSSWQPQSSQAQHTHQSHAPANGQPPPPYGPPQYAQPYGMYPPPAYGQYGYYQQPPGGPPPYHAYPHHPPPQQHNYGPPGQQPAHPPHPPQPPK